MKLNFRVHAYSIYLMKIRRRIYKPGQGITLFLDDCDNDKTVVEEDQTNQEKSYAGNQNAEANEPDVTHDADFQHQQEETELE